MAYTPELSQRYSGALRRIAWALDQPMTRTLESIFDWIGKAVDPRQICEACRDKSVCADCVFHPNTEHGLDTGRIQTGDDCLHCGDSMKAAGG